MRQAGIFAALVAILAAACHSGTEPRVTAANPLADSADQVMFGISTMITNQGVLRAQLKADTAYFFDGNSRIEVRNERTLFYTNTGQQSAVLTSREGTYRVQIGQMVARHDVLVTTTDGKRLTTQELNSNEQTNQVSSDSAFVLTEPDRQVRGVGFVSDPELTNFTVKRVMTGSGTFTLPGSPP